MEQPKYPPEPRRSDEAGTTADLARYTAVATAPPPADDLAVTEQHIRTRGRWLTISGIVVTLLTAGIAGVWHGGFQQDMPLAFALPLQSLGVGAIAIGALEYLSRPSRHAQRELLGRVGDLEAGLGGRISHLEAGLHDLVGLLDEDKQQSWYRGYAARTRDEQRARTGTDNARSLGRPGEVLRFRRNGG
jgi:hypothetical protein